MKKICFVFGLSLFAWSCSNNNAKDNATMDQHMKTDAKTVSTNPHAKTDPVCGMSEGDIAYTDFSVYQKDTTWFCSPHCKESFDKDPAKYVKK